MGNGSASHSPVSNGALTGLEELVDVKLSELGRSAYACAGPSRAGCARSLWSPPLEIGVVEDEDLKRDVRVE
jgi:hypothetical protein